MQYESRNHAQHTGSEQFAVSFNIAEKGALYDVKGTFVNFTIRPDTVTLVWERHRKNEGWGPWRRSNYRMKGAFSCVSGGRVLKNDSVSHIQRSFAEVFKTSQVGGELTDYAKSLPGFPALVDMLETAKLPQ